MLPSKATKDMKIAFLKTDWLDGETEESAFYDGWKAALKWAAERNTSLRVHHTSSGYNPPPKRKRRKPRPAPLYPELCP